MSVTSVKVQTTGSGCGLRGTMYHSNEINCYGCNSTHTGGNKMGWNRKRRTNYLSDATRPPALIVQMVKFRQFVNGVSSSSISTMR